MEQKISQVRSWIRQTRKNLEKIARVCDSCVLITRNEFIDSLNQQNRANLQYILYSLKSLSNNGRYLRVIEELKEEVTGLKKNYDYIRDQYFTLNTNRREKLSLTK